MTGNFSVTYWPGGTRRFCSSESLVPPMSRSNIGVWGPFAGAGRRARRASGVCAKSTQAPGSGDDEDVTRQPRSMVGNQAWQDTRRGAFGPWRWTFGPCRPEPPGGHVLRSGWPTTTLGRPLRAFPPRGTNLERGPSSPEPEIARLRLLEGAVDGAQDEARGLCALAAELLARLLVERGHQVADGLVDERRPVQRTVGEGRLQPVHGPAGILHRVALLGQDGAELGASGGGGIPALAHGTSSAPPTAGGGPAPTRPARHSSARMPICTSSQWRPSRQIASRSRPSTRKPAFS